MTGWGLVPAGAGGGRVDVPVRALRAAVDEGRQEGLF
jgi:hypothetical protein